MLFCKEKTKGYKDDMAPTNHPVEADCDTSEQAEGLIDGITYGKGACFARQLIMIIGIEAFLKGLQSYFTKFKWGNTTLNDFINCMQNAYAPDSNNLTDFTNKWLKSKGVNSYKVELEQDGSAFILHQGYLENAD